MSDIQPATAAVVHAVSGVHQTRQPSAVAGQIPVASLLPTHVGALQVWGNFLRMDNLRFRPAYMRVADETTHEGLARLMSTGARPPPHAPGEMT